MIKSKHLNDVLKLTEEELVKSKIRFMISSSDGDPCECYKRSPQKVVSSWLLWKKVKQPELYHKGDIAIGLMRLEDHPDKWLLVTVQEILEQLKRSEDGVGYGAQICDKCSAHFEKVIVSYHNTCRNMCRRAQGLIEQLKVEGT